MGCNCKWTEIVLAVVVLVFALWTTWVYSQWVVVIAAILLLLHALMCKNCGTCKPSENMPKKSSRKKK